ncbi:MAG: glycosyltransferase [Candidatus Pacebacteria bacterium]|nr:glycosyltransferase [Candidatus Paceibacterota bacterium]
MKGYTRWASKVQLFLCNRNFSKTKDLLWLKTISPQIQIFLINPLLFYKKSFLDNLLNQYSGDIVQFENPEFAINNSQFILQNIHKKVFILELHNLYYKLNRSNTEFNILKNALQLTDYTICFSEDDCKIIKHDFELSADKIICSPIFVDCSDYKFYGSNITKNEILFMGNFCYKPNADAAIFLIKEVYPILRKNFLQFHLHFLGNYPPKFLPVKSNNWTFHGFLDTEKQSSILNNIKLCVAPLFGGYGSRVKMLEYATFGFPILATKQAMVGTEKLQGIFIAQKNNFAFELSKRLQQNTLLYQYGVINRKNVEKYYSIEKVIPELLFKITKKPLKNKPIQYVSSKIYIPSWIKEQRHFKKVLKDVYVIEKNTIKKI